MLPGHPGESHLRWCRNTRLSIAVSHIKSRRMSERLAIPVIGACPTTAYEAHQDSLSLQGPHSRFGYALVKESGRSHHPVRHGPAPYTPHDLAGAAATGEVTVRQPGRGCGAPAWFWTFHALRYRRCLPGVAGSRRHRPLGREIVMFKTR